MRSSWRVRASASMWQYYSGDEYLVPEVSTQGSTGTL